MRDYPYELSLMTVEPVGINYAPMLPAGRSIASAQAWLKNELGVGTAIAGANIATTSTTVTVTVGPFTSAEKYTLSVIATCDGSTPVPKLPFSVLLEVLVDDDGTP